MATAVNVGSLQCVPKSTPNDETLKTVVQDGTVIIEGFLSEDVMDAFKAEMALDSGLPIIKTSPIT